jgi:ribosomal protein L6P/L9E
MLGAPDRFMLVAGFVHTISNMTDIIPSFPINVNLDKNKETDCWEVEIRNFIGEKLVRRVIMRPGVEVEASKNQKDQLELSGNVRIAVQVQSQALLTNT